MNMKKIYEIPSVELTMLTTSATVLGGGSPTPPVFDPTPVEEGGGGD